MSVGRLLDLYDLSVLMSLGTVKFPRQPRLNYWELDGLANMICEPRRTVSPKGNCLRDQCVIR